MNAWIGVSQQFVFIVQIGIFAARDRVIRITFGLRKFVHDTGFVMDLARQIFEFGNPGIGLLVRIIDDRRLLIYFAIVGLMFKFKRAIWQFPIAVIEIFVNRPGIDNF